MIWASPRELLNMFQADAVGCHVITATTTCWPSCLVGKDLTEFSLETVEMFRKDARPRASRSPRWRSRPHTNRRRT